MKINSSKERSKTKERNQKTQEEQTRKNAETLGGKTRRSVREKTRKRLPHIRQNIIKNYYNDGPIYARYGQENGENRHWEEKKEPGFQGPIMPVWGGKTPESITS